MALGAAAALIPAIPPIMRAQQPPWDKAATLMERWFTSPANSNSSVGIPDTTTITMAWVCTFARVNQEYQKMVAGRKWVNNAAQLEIAKLLRAQGKLGAQPTTFGNLTQPVNILDKDYIQYHAVGDLVSLITWPLDHLTAALARFVFRMVVAGTVQPVMRGGRTIHSVEIHEVGIYVRDSYDFNSVLPLGCWDPANNRVARYPNSLTSFCVDNLDFQAWRKLNGNFGGDFLIFSDLRRLIRTPPDTFDIP